MRRIFRIIFAAFAILPLTSCDMFSVDNNYVKSEIRFTQSEYTYQLDNIYELEYSLYEDGNMIEKGITDGQFGDTYYSKWKITENSANASFYWADGEGGAVLTIKGKTVGRCVFTLQLFKNYHYFNSNKPITINFEHKSSYKATFIDIDGYTIIGSCEHKYNEPISFPVLDYEDFIGWTDSINCYRKDEMNVLETKDNKYYAMTGKIQGTEGLIYEECVDGVYVSSYSGIESNVVIPLEVSGKLVRYIASNAFKNKAIDSIYISPLVNSIYKNAFSGSLVKKVIFGRGSMLTYIGDNAFRSCVSLRTIVIPRWVTTCADSAFDNCSEFLIVMAQNENFSKYIYSDLGSIFESRGSIEPYLYTGVSSFVDSDSSKLFSYAILNDGTVAVVRYLDSVASSSPSVEIIDGFNVSAIWAFSFYQTNVKTVKVGSNITHLSDKCFNNMPYLESIDLNEATNLKSAGYHSFYKCPLLKSLDFKNTKLSTIEHAAICELSGIEDIYLPKTVSNISDKNFDSCPSLSIYLEAKNDSNITIKSSSGRPFYWNIKEIVQESSDLRYKYCITNDGKAILIRCLIGSNTIDLSKKIDGYDIVQIGNNAFRDRNNLIKVTLPDTLEQINDYAFYGCSNLEEIVFPNNCSIKTIGNYAFYGCQSLIAFHVVPSITSIGRYCFDECSSLNILFTLLDPTNVSLSSHWNYDSRPISYGVKELKYKEFNENGSFYYYEKHDGTLGLLKWFGLTGNCGPTDNLSITEIDGKPFTEIAPYAFQSRLSYDSGSIFDWYSRDVKITIGKKVKVIGDSAFQSIYEETENLFETPETKCTIVFEKGSELEKIGNYAFQSSGIYLNNFIVPKSVTHIGTLAFGRITWLPGSIIWMEKGDKSGMTLGSNWNANQNVIWGTDWHYDANGKPVLNS